MDLTALLLSRIQFGSTVAFHIIFPSFTIGLAAWLTVLEAMHLWTGRPVYRLVFEFWLKIFGMAFGLGVVSGIVMAFQFGTNWSVLSRMSGPIQGPLLSYETFTAFFLEASFFGVLLFGRSRVPPWFYLFSTAMVALGTTLSAFWILVNNSWMQVPTGYVMENGQFVPNDWFKITLSPVVWVRFPHMLLASYLAGAFCVAATGAWYLLRGIFAAEARVMLRMGLYLAAVLVPVQLVFGHLNGEYVVHHQPSKMAAIEARWHDEKPASEVLLAWPDVESHRNLFAITLPPPFGSLIDSDSLSAGEVGLDSIPPENWPPVAIPFFSFRIMVGCWDHYAADRLGRLVFDPQGARRAEPVAAVGDVPELPAAVHRDIDRLDHRRGRAPALGSLRRAADRRRDDAIPDGPCGGSFAGRLLRRLQLHLRVRNLLHLSAAARRTGRAPGSAPGGRSSQPPDVGCPRAPPRTRRIAVVMFWVAILAVSILLYVLLDGFDLGVGILFGLTGDETRRRAMMSAVAPIWDGNETWLVVAGVVLWGAFPVVYATLLSAFYLPLVLMLAGLILRGVAFEYRSKTERLRWIWDFSFAGGSLVAAFMQGLTVGALVEQLPISNGHYTGGEFGWFSPFAVLCGIGLCLGYSLLGACWLVRKCEGDVREAAYRLIPYLAVGLLVFLVVVFAYALFENLRVVHRWIERPYLFAFPAIGVIAALVAAESVRSRRDGVPFYMVALIFAAAFGTLAISFWPYMIPFSITIEEAAAPHSSLAFMFWGAGLFVFPLMLLYTVISYTVFRGKVRPTAGHY